jgi:hypothetical protein
MRLFKWFLWSAAGLAVLMVAGLLYVIFYLNASAEIKAAVITSVFTILAVLITAGISIFTTHRTAHITGQTL